MPNRILRDFTTSERVDGLSPKAENIFIRLMTQADDYGVFYSNPKLIKAACIPLKEWSIKEVGTLILEIEKAGLIFRYEHGDREFIKIVDFKQRLQNMRNRFPEPTKEQEDKAMKNISREVTVSHRESPPETKRSRNETETEVETESEGETKSRKRETPPHLFVDSEYFDFEKFRKSLEESPPPYSNANPESYYEAAKNYSQSKNKKYADWISAVKNWIRKDVEEGTLKSKFSGPKPISSGFKSKQQIASEQNRDQLSRLFGGAKGTGPTEQDYGSTGS